MKTLTTWNLFRKLDEVQNRLGSFFPGLPTRFGNGNGESLKQKKKYHRIERSYGSFLRSFTVFTPHVDRMKSGKARPHHRIEIFVRTIEQLFNTMDPSPFHEKDLDRDAEEFIVSWAQEYPVRDSLALIVHLHGPSTGADATLSVRAAVHNYFAYRKKLNRQALTHLLKQGRISLVIGVVFLAACLLMRELLVTGEPRTFHSLARESLTIAGWVAMWRPMQVFLYDWWPLLRLNRIYRKLSHMPVELKFREES